MQTIHDTRPIRDAALVFALAVLLGAWPMAGRAAGETGDMPELPQAGAEFWINSPPLKKADVAGQVVLIEIWTST